MLGRSTTRILSTVFNEKLVKNVSENAKNYIQHVQPAEVIIATSVFVGAVTGGAIGKQVAINSNDGKLGTVVEVGVGASLGAGLGLAGGGVVALALSEAPGATALTFIGGVLGSSLAKKRTPSVSKNEIEMEKEVARVERSVPAPRW